MRKTSSHAKRTMRIACLRNLHLRIVAEPPQIVLHPSESIREEENRSHFRGSAERKVGEWVKAFPCLKWKMGANGKLTLPLLKRVPGATVERGVQQSETFYHRDPVKDSGLECATQGEHRTGMKDSVDRVCPDSGSLPHPFWVYAELLLAS